MAHSFRAHYFHLIWSTKNRLPLITEQIQSELYPYIAKIAGSNNALVLDINGMPDHLHLLMEIEVPDHFTSIVREMKASSSSFVKRRFKTDKFFAWQEGYGSFSVSQSSIEKVRAYIQNQKQHHAKLSFEDEFRLILRRHQITYDERFVLG